MGEAAERLALRAYRVREDLGDVHPDDCAGRTREERDEAEDAEDRKRRVALVAKRELPRDERVHEDHQGRAADDHRLAAELVDDEECEDREGEVHGADAHRAGERRHLASRAEDHVEDARRVVVDRVDAGHLVEEGDEEREQDGLQVLALEKRNARAGPDLLQGLLDLAENVRHGLALLGEADTRENAFGLVLAAGANEPARRLGDSGEKRHEDGDRQALHAKHHAPLDHLNRHRVRGEDARKMLAHVAEPAAVDRHPARDEVVRDVADEDAEDDVELVGRDEAPAQTPWRDLDDVERNDDRDASDGETADKAKPAEKVRADRRVRRCKRAANRRDEEQGAHQPQRWTTAPLVGRRSRAEDADHSAY